MTASAAWYLVQSLFALNEANKSIAEGFSNTIPIEEAYYSNFRMPDGTECNVFGSKSCSTSDALHLDHIHESWATLTLAVSYSHTVEHSGTLLKANQFQISQLEDILSAIRENPPLGTKYVRIWTDGAHSKTMAASKGKDRPKWIFHGLLPYAVFPVAWLSSGDETDKASMWCSCEQLLGDRALGCLFSLKGGRIPPFGKLIYCGSNIDRTKVVKTVGDSLSINRNLTKLAAAIHFGVLDESVTYHIADAQELIRLAYYMTRNGLSSMVHAVNCRECLHATSRESLGFMTAINACCDLYDESAENVLQLCLGPTRISYPYPIVRARKGYIDWHGFRELVPGAGRFVKVTPPIVLEKYTGHMRIVSVYRNNLPSTAYALLVAAYPCSDGSTRYFVLLIHVQNLFSVNCRVFYSVRLNIKDLAKLHHGVKHEALSGEVSELLRHPELDQLLSQFEFRIFHRTSEVSWGRWGLSRRTKQREVRVSNTKVFKRVINSMRRWLDFVTETASDFFAAMIAKADRYCAGTLNERRLGKTQ
ncbi:hypothetical protein FGB62_107g123 [Gracilaria domingensis]|nr:hypothetical protein FGB62_107g123 [Gracilaria domingensis]